MRKSTIFVFVLLVASIMIAPNFTLSESDKDSFNTWRPGQAGIGCHTFDESGNQMTSGDIFFDRPVYVVAPGETFTVSATVDSFGADLSGSSNDLVIGYNILDGDNEYFIDESVAEGTHTLSSGDSVTAYEQEFTAPDMPGSYVLHSYAIGGTTSNLWWIDDNVQVIVTDGFDGIQYVDDIVRQLDLVKEAGVSDGYKWVETNKAGDEIYKSGQTKGAASIGNLMLDIYEERLSSSLFMGLNTEDLSLPLELAVGAGDWLVSLKTSDGGGGSFWYEVYYANETTTNDVIVTSYYGGVAGISSFLARLYRITHDATYLTAATEGMQYLLNQNTADDTPTGNTYTVTAGHYAWAEKNGVDANKTSTRWSKGSPGVGSTFLEMYRMTGNAEYYDAAHGLFLFLDANKETEGTTTYWPQYVGDDTSSIYLGRWHGVAGIVSFLIDLYHVSEDAAVKALIDTSMAYLVAHAEDDGADGVKFENKVGGEEYQAGFSRGGAGIGTVFLRAHEIDDSKGYLDIIDKIYTNYENIAIASGNGWAFADSNLASKQLTGMGHGGSGIGMFMLYAYQQTGDIKFFEGATNIANGLGEASFIGDNGVTWNKSTTDEYVDYYPYYGVGGVATFFLNYDTMGNYDALQTAIKATTYLLDVAVVDGDGLKWAENDKSGDPVYKTGLLKGAAGNALELMSLYQRLSSEVNYFGLTTNATYAYLEAAEGAMKWLDSVKLSLNGGSAWHESYYANGTAASSKVIYSQYAGAAGIADMFTRLSQFTGNQAYMTTATEVATFIVADAITTTGYAWTENNADPTNATLASTRWTYGTPGVGSFFVNMYLQTGTTSYLNVANGIVTWLDSVKTSETEGVGWNRYPHNGDSTERYLGRWHGVTGVATFLLDLYAATGDAATLDLALDAMAYVASQGIVNATSESVKWENKVGGGEYQAGFSRGAAGIGSIFNRLYKMTGDIMYYEYVEMALNRYAESLADTTAGWAWTDSNLASKIFTATGHGSAGIMIFAAEVYQTSHHPLAYAIMANSITYLNSIENTVGNGVAWDKSTTDEYTATTMYYGVAGIAFALIEAANFVNMAPEVTGDITKDGDNLTFSFDVTEDIGIDKVTLTIGAEVMDIPVTGDYIYDASELTADNYTATIAVYDVAGLMGTVDIDFEIDTEVTSGPLGTVTVTVTETVTEDGPYPFFFALVGFSAMVILIKRRK